MSNRVESAVPVRDDITVFVVVRGIDVVRIFVAVSVALTEFEPFDTVAVDDAVSVGLFDFERVDLVRIFVDVSVALTEFEPFDAVADTVFAIVGRETVTVSL